MAVRSAISKAIKRINTRVDALVKAGLTMTNEYRRLEKGLQAVDTFTNKKGVTNIKYSQEFNDAQKQRLLRLANDDKLTLSAVKKTYKEEVESGYGEATYKEFKREYKKATGSTKGVFEAFIKKRETLQDDLHDLIEANKQAIYTASSKLTKALKRKWNEKLTMEEVDELLALVGAKKEDIAEAEKRTAEEFETDLYEDDLPW